jgi:hypothetical protein
MPTPRLKHLKIWTQLALGIMSKSMLEKVWWCRCSEMEFLNQIIWCLMNCSKGKKNMHMLGVVKDHMFPWSVIGKKKCCCWTMLQLQKGKDINQP